MLNTFEETFEVMEMRTFKYEPFFIVGAEGGGAYSWYFTVISTHTLANDIHVCHQSSPRNHSCLLTDCENAMFSNVENPRHCQRWRRISSYPKGGPHP